jgi:hypothetical protein
MEFLTHKIVVSIDECLKEVNTIALFGDIFAVTKKS